MAASGFQHKPHQSLQASPRGSPQALPVRSFTQLGSGGGLPSIRQLERVAELGEAATASTSHLRPLTLPPIPSMRLPQEPDLLNQLTPSVPPFYPPNPLASNLPALISFQQQNQILSNPLPPMQLCPSYYQEDAHPSQRHSNHPQGSPEAHIRRRRHRLPSGATTALKEWFFKNESNPYPTEEEKAYLVGLTGLSHSQVNNWFINARRRFPRGGNRPSQRPAQARFQPPIIRAQHNHVDRWWIVQNMTSCGD